MKKKISLLTLAIAVATYGFYIFNTFVVLAASCDKIEDLEKKVDCLADVVASKQATQVTLSAQLQNLDNQINLTEARIQNSIAQTLKTTKDIEKLSGDLVDLGVRIDKLEDSIDYQKKVFGARMRSRYKINETSPLIVLFGSETINELVQKAEYLQVMGIQDNKLLDQMTETKNAYFKQKDIFETKKKESEDLKAKLVREKANLDAYKVDLAEQKDEKQTLLSATQADEQKYQELLDKAEKELAAMKNFVQSAGGGAIGSNEFGAGKEGWYFSQRDSKWANKKIGKSNDTIFEVGCLLTSVAMIYKHYGYSATPATIAADNSRFLYPTANMLIPWKGPGGRSYHSILKSQIDAELKNNPVIVGVYAGPYGTHFVVLAKKSGNDYIMYDPYYGPDLKFSSRYSTSSIFQAVVFK